MKICLFLALRVQKLFFVPAPTGRTIERDGCIGPIDVMCIPLSRVRLRNVCRFSDRERRWIQFKSKYSPLAVSRDDDCGPCVDSTALVHRIQYGCGMIWFSIGCSLARWLPLAGCCLSAHPLTSIYLCSILLLNFYSYFILYCCCGCWLFNDDDVLWSRSQSILNIILIFLTHHQLIVFNDQ